jgi:hypothetical protein
VLSSENQILQVPNLSHEVELEDVEALRVSSLERKKSVKYL